MAPDAICGEAKRNGRFKRTVCTKTLYNYIDQCLLTVRNIDLPLKVKRKARTVQKSRKNKRIFGTSIEERPEEINNRTTFGHWKIDTIVGKQGSSAVLLSLDERTKLHRHLVKIPSRSREGVGLGLKKISEYYGDSFEKVFKSVTCDSGSEFVDLGSFLPKSTKVYHAHPYSAYERGINEKQNSLVRRFFPKGLSFYNVQMSRSLSLNAGSTVCLAKSSITARLTISSSLSYLTLQFRVTGNIRTTSKKVLTNRSVWAII